MPSFSLGRSRRSKASPGGEAHPPIDPRLVIPGPLDPALEAIRAGLRPHRRRLWLRRIVRRAWLVVGTVVVAEVALFAFARIVPLEILEASGIIPASRVEALRDGFFT